VNKLKLIDITPESISNISNNELLNLHWRIHQLYIQKIRTTLSDEFKKMLIQKHQILVVEMNKRNMKHKTAIVEAYLNKFI
jgi:hypothetical protein